MRLLVVTVLVLAGCRPADGDSQTPPPSGSSAARDSARVDSLLARADAGRIQGASTAPVWLVEISDFECPYCRQWHDEVYPAVKRDYIDKGIVRMAYVHFPLQQHRNAMPAAEASLCASAQDRFWPMHDRLFGTQKRWVAMPNPAAVFDSLAVASGVNAAVWRECMRGGAMRRVVTGDIARAGSSGVRSTPTFFVGDQLLRGVAPIDSFRVAIERARAKAAGRPAR